jgi:hypothetical protein
MDTSRLVTLRSFSTSLDAEIAKQHLESAGVQAHIRKDDYGGLEAAIQSIEGVFLQVLEKDAETAEEILKSLNI